MFLIASRYKIAHGVPQTDVSKLDAKIDEGLLFDMLLCMCLSQDWYPIRSTK